MSCKAIGPTGIPNFVATLVDCVHRGPFQQQGQGLRHVGQQDAVDEKTGAVVDDDRRLLDPLGQLDDRHHRFVAGPLAADDLDKLHPVDRQEKVHADETASGRARTSAIRVIEMVDVFVARMASFRRTGANCR